MFRELLTTVQLREYKPSRQAYINKQSDALYLIRPKKIFTEQYQRIAPVQI